MGYVFKVEEGSPGDVVHVVVELEFKMTPRFQVCGEEDRVQLLRERLNFWVVLVRDVGPMMIMSDLSLFSWK